MPPGKRVGEAFRRPGMRELAGHQGHHPPHQHGGDGQSIPLRDSQPGANQASQPSQRQQKGLLPTFTGQRAVRMLADEHRAAERRTAVLRHQMPETASVVMRARQLIG